ncbi:MAG: hypothetical protein J6V54_10865 [Bacteroidales bacterium]|nr:hypothetical protein [Bacteroidales bacterium]
MSRKFLNSKERVLYYIEKKNISKNKFYTLTGVSNGVLDKKSELSISTIEKIYYTFPELSLEWILFEKGEMLRENIEKNQQNGVVSEKIFREILEENQKLNREIGRLEGEIERLKKAAAPGAGSAECAAAAI